jgi:phosphate transport system substrate-binding protein
MVRSAIAATVAVFMVLAAGAAQAQVRGVGASFPSKVYARWIAQYQRDTGLALSYKPTGSGDGVKQISERKVEFAGSDSPLPAAELSKRRLVQIPMVIGGIVPVVNLPGVDDGELKLDGPLLADILLGTVERWNDPRIVALNPGLKLPALPVRRVVRADKSGTTEGFARYLAQVSPAFKMQAGVSQLPAWPGKTTPAEGNDGMVQALKAAPGSIAYVSYDRVAHDKLAGVQLLNAAGRFVKASEAGFRSAIRESELGRAGDDLASLMDRPGPDTWPITSATFVLVDASPSSATAASPVLRFLYWCYLHGDDLTRGTGFAPLPATLQSRLSARFASVKAQDGQQLQYVSF